jgi:hypothetical protein
MISATDSLHSAVFYIVMMHSDKLHFHKAQLETDRHNGGSIPIRKLLVADRGDVVGNPFTTSKPDISCDVSHMACELAHTSSKTRILCFFGDSASFGNLNKVAESHTVFFVVRSTRYMVFLHRDARVSRFHQTIMSATARAHAHGN